MKIYIKSAKYFYQGSIADQSGRILIRDAEFYTSAPTIGRAKTNILSQAKSRLGYAQTAKLELCRPDAIEEVVDKEYAVAPGQDIKRCPECGYQLSDGGYCPRCYAYGDETNYLE